MISFLALVLAAQSATPVQLASSQSGDADVDRRNEVICRQRPVTGTRLRFTRVCMTRQEWDERREQHTRGVREFTTTEMASQRPPDGPE